MERTYKIYVLKDPETLEVKYVGITTKTLKERLRGHLKETKDTRKKNYHKKAWINNLIEKDLLPTIELLEVCTADNWEEREIFHIANFKELGCNLTNIDIGGKGIYIKSRNNTSKEKIVYQYDLDGNYIQEHRSATAAANYIKCAGTSIGRVLTGDRGSCKGFQWSYNKTENKEEFINAQCSYINCYKIEKTPYKLFASQQKLINELGVTYDEVKKSLKYGSIIKGYTFEKRESN